ncbi:MAG: hypothetical protein JJE35_12105 [Thermoleophilia bacterium]|nr:hypothetical protein [Thermoleophilia bacterium]
MGQQTGYDSAHSPRPRADQLIHNAYITDGQRLFRCLPASEGSMLILEDCSTPELILCEADELLQAELRLVRPGFSLEPDLRPRAPVVAT